MRGRSECFFVFQPKLFYHLQPHQHVIISPQHPQITPIWVNLTSSVSVQRCTHMPIHSIWMCSNTFYIYNMDVKKKWVVFYSVNHVNTSLFHPTISRLYKSRSTWPVYSSVTVQGCTEMPIHSIWMCSNTFYIHNMDLEKKWVVFYSLNHVTASLFHPIIPRLHISGSTWPAV